MSRMWLQRRLLSKNQALLRWKGTTCLLRSPLLAVLSMPGSMPGTLTLEGSKEVPCIDVDTQSKSCDSPFNLWSDNHATALSAGCGFGGYKTYIFPSVRVDPSFFSSSGDFQQQGQLPSHGVKVYHENHHISCCTELLCLKPLWSIPFWLKFWSPWSLREKDNEQK